MVIVSIKSGKLSFRDWKSWGILLQKSCRNSGNSDRVWNKDKLHLCLRWTMAMVDQVIASFGRVFLCPLGQSPQKRSGICRHKYMTGCLLFCVVRVRLRSYCSCLRWYLSSFCHYLAHCLSASHHTASAEMRKHLELVCCYCFLVGWQLLIFFIFIVVIALAIVFLLFVFNIQNLKIWKVQLMPPVLQQTALSHWCLFEG